MTKYDKNEAFRYKRYVKNENENFSSSFCGLSNNETRERMQQEAERLDKYQDSDFNFGSESERFKRQTTRERTCCYIYIRIDPTLWNIVYENEGLNVNAIVLF